MKNLTLLACVVALTTAVKPASQTPAARSAAYQDSHNLFVHFFYMREALKAEAASIAVVLQHPQAAPNLLPYFKKQQELNEELQDQLLNITRDKSRQTLAQLQLICDRAESGLPVRLLGLKEHRNHLNRYRNGLALLKKQGQSLKETDLADLNTRIAYLDQELKKFDAQIAFLTPSPVGNTEQEVKKIEQQLQQLEADWAAIATFFAKSHATNDKIEPADLAKYQQQQVENIRQQSRLTNLLKTFSAKAPYTTQPTTESDTKNSVASAASATATAAPAQHHLSYPPSAPSPALQGIFNRGDENLTQARTLMEALAASKAQHEADAADEDIRRAIALSLAEQAPARAASLTASATATATPTAPTGNRALATPAASDERDRKHTYNARAQHPLNSAASAPVWHAAQEAAALDRTRTTLEDRVNRIPHHADVDADLERALRESAQESQVDPEMRQAAQQLEALTKEEDELHQNLVGLKDKSAHEREYLTPGYQDRLRHVIQQRLSLEHILNPNSSARPNPGDRSK